MTEREQLEWAAKACERTLQYCTVTDYKGKIVDQFITGWNPLTDQADSDRMACKLRIDLSFYDAYIGCRFEANKAFVLHNNTDEDVCRAVREARMLVAVEIGESMV